MKTVLVVYTDKRLDAVSVWGSALCTKYAFRCPYDLRVGDRVKDKRYTTDMLVVKVIEQDMLTYYGHVLKLIYPDSINDRAGGTVLHERAKECNNNNTNNMETKNIQVTIEEAREWFNSGNKALRTLAINAFGEERLSLTYESIRCKVDSLSTCVEVPTLEENAFQANAKLAIMARHFNGSWHRNVDNSGYFLGARRNIAYGTGPVAVIDRFVGVYKHDTVLYGGVVYFENANDAIKAAELLGNDLNSLLGI